VDEFQPEAQDSAPLLQALTTRDLLEGYFPRRNKDNVRLGDEITEAMMRKIEGHYANVETDKEAPSEEVISALVDTLMTKT
jgi:hypothetical protein